MNRLIVFSFLFSISALAESGLSLSIWKKNENKNFLFKHRFLDTEQSSEHDSLIGIRYRHLPNLKSAIYFINSKIGNNEEQSFILQMLPRYIFSSLPSTVFEIRPSYHYKINTENHVIDIAPNFSHFIFHKGRPLFTIFFRYTHYFFLSHSSDRIKLKSIYTGALYHFNNTFKIGFNWNKKKRQNRNLNIKDNEYYFNFIILI